MLPSVHLSNTSSLPREEALRLGPSFAWTAFSPECAWLEASCPANVFKYSCLREPPRLSGLREPHCQSSHISLILSTELTLVRSFAMCFHIAFRHCIFFLAILLPEYTLQLRRPCYLPSTKNRAWYLEGVSIFLLLHNKLPSF